MSAKMEHDIEAVLAGRTGQAATRVTQGSPRRYRRVPCKAVRPDSRPVRLCVCGHPYAAHQHYRRGTECSLCPDCRRWRRSLGQKVRDVRRLMGRRPHPPEFVLRSWRANQH